jgi:4-carboxymuconolactone decarboxylase
LISQERRVERLRSRATTQDKIEEKELKYFLRNLLFAACIMLAGGMVAMVHTQGEAPAMTASSQVEANKSPTRAQQLMGGIAPKMVELTDNVLYGDVWERPQLSKRDRSLATVSALVAMNRPDQLRSHLALARRNGVTEEELVEAITHLAFYAGWPNAVTAIQVAKEVFNRN